MIMNMTVPVALASVAERAFMQKQPVMDDTSIRTSGVLPGCDVPKEKKITYARLSSDAAVNHLRELGVTAASADAPRS
jgi:hypothetical protein